MRKFRISSNIWEEVSEDEFRKFAASQISNLEGLVPVKLETGRFRLNWKQEKEIYSYIASDQADFFEIYLQDAI